MTVQDLLNSIPSDLNAIITTIVTIITGIATTIFFVRRKFSRDNVEIAKDRAEESIIQHLEEQRKIALHERDRVMVRFEKLESEKIEMLHQIFKLSTELQSLSEQISILKTFVSRLGTSLDDYKEQLKMCQEENKKLTLEIVELEHESHK